MEYLETNEIRLEEYVVLALLELFFAINTQQAYYLHHSTA
jgi:hypothetical protein